MFKKSKTKENTTHTAAAASSTQPAKAKSSKSPKFSKKISLKNAVKMYIIFPHTAAGKSIDDVSVQQSAITFVSTKDEALLAIDRLIYLNHYEHYKMWCENRSLPWGFYENSWFQYRDNLGTRKEDIPDEDKFIVYEVYYKASNVASMLRIFTGCRPLLLEYEDIDEVAHYLDQANDDDAEYVSHLIASDPDLQQGLHDELKILNDVVEEKLNSKKHTKKRKTSDHTDA